MTRETAEWIEMALVGHTTRHWPQLTQSLSPRFLPKAGVTMARVPRRAMSMALTFWTFSHIRTQSPQRIHLLGSRTMLGELLSTGRWRR